jgi:hypothetical protein
MTAHREKPTITEEHVVWFATYKSDNPSWGVFHVCLDDGNWKLGASPDREHLPLQVRIACEWFDQLTASQRRRLRDKVDKLLGPDRSLTRFSRAC